MEISHATLNTNSFFPHVQTVLLSVIARTPILLAGIKRQKVRFLTETQRNKKTFRTALVAPRRLNILMELYNMNYLQHGKWNTWQHPVPVTQVRAVNDEIKCTIRFRKVVLLKSTDLFYFWYIDMCYESVDILLVHISVSNNPCWIHELIGCHRHRAVRLGRMVFQEWYKYCFVF